MKHLLSLLILILLISCEKEYSSPLEEKGVKIVYDTVYVCPDEKPDSLIVANARLTRTNSPRSCFYVYELPPIKNDGQGVEYIINPPLKFDWDCDWDQTDFIDFTNIGERVILSPSKPRLFGDIAYRVIELTKFYVQPYGIGVVDKLGTDSIIVVINNPKVNIPSVIVKKEDEIVVSEGDFLELTPRN